MDETFPKRFNDSTFVSGLDHLPSSHIFTKVATIAAGRLRPTGRLLDVCCGTGKASLSVLAQRVPKEIVLVDLSDEALRIAEANLNAAHNGHSKILIKGIQSDVAALTEDMVGLADVIVMAYGLHLLAAPSVGIQKLYSLLSEEGILLLTVPGGNIYRFRNAKNNVPVSESDVAHPFFTAFRDAVREYESDIIQAFDEETLEGFAKLGLVRKANGAFRVFPLVPPFMNSGSLRRILADAGLVKRQISCEVVDWTESVDQRLAFASLNNSPPLPGIWDLFDHMAESQRSTLVAAMIASVRARLGGSTLVPVQHLLITISKHSCKE